MTTNNEKGRIACRQGALGENLRVWGNINKPRITKMMMC